MEFISYTNWIWILKIFVSLLLLYVLNRISKSTQGGGNGNINTVNEMNNKKVSGWNGIENTGPSDIHFILCA